MILLNEYPFSIIKAKSDVIEGPYMEYAAKYRSVVFVTRGFLMFVLGALFSVLFIEYLQIYFHGEFWLILL